MSIEKIRNIGLDKLVTQIYDFDSLTTDELLCKFAQKINIIIEHFKYLDDRCYNSDKAMEEKLQYLLGQGLEEQVAKRLLELIDNGTLGELINQTLLKEINDKVDNNTNYIKDISVNVKMFGAKGDGVTDDTEAIKQAIQTGRNVYFPLGVYVVTDELLITTKGQLLYGEGMGSGVHGIDTIFTGVTNYHDETTLLFKGTGNKSIKTRVKTRKTQDDPEDNPISTAINIQAEGVRIENLCVRLNIDKVINDRNNMGDDWDIGIFVSNRPLTTMTNVNVIGYWRKACIYFDVTGSTLFPPYNNYPNGVINCSDGVILTNVTTYGGLWGLYIKGIDYDPTANNKYFDSVSNRLYDDWRGSGGFSDLLCVGCKFYANFHHSKYRIKDFSGNIEEDITAGGCVYIDAYCRNNWNAIHSHTFDSCRFSTQSILPIYMANTQYDTFVNCWWDYIPCLSTSGEVVDSYTKTDFYGNVYSNSENRKFTRFMSCGHSPYEEHFDYKNGDMVVGNAQGALYDFGQYFKFINKDGKNDFVIGCKKENGIDLKYQDENNGNLYREQLVNNQLIKQMASPNGSIKPIWTYSVSDYAYLTMLTTSGVSIQTNGLDLKDNAGASNITIFNGGNIQLNKNGTGINLKNNNGDIYKIYVTDDGQIGIAKQ